MATEVRETVEITEIPVGLHFGNMIQYVAQMHGTGFEVLREGVQNAFDKLAQNIFVIIDCVRRTITTYDDGDGASENEIKAKFNQIGLSIKIGQPGMIGQKGIGNIAPFAIGRQWNLLTKDIKHGGPLISYTFDRSELVKKDNLKLQMEVVPFKSVTGAPFKPVTTMLRIVDVEEGVLRQLGDKGTIERTLREAFNTKLRTQKITLRVLYRDTRNRTSEFVVKPTRFRGTPIESVEYETEHGAVTFEFFHSPEPLKDPSILVLHQGVYSLPLTNFFKLRMLLPEVEPWFNKGYFDGEIRLGFCSLNSSRSAFEHNAELQSFVKAIESFATEILKPIIEQFEQADRKDRLQKIAESVLKKMKQYLTKYPNLLPAHLKGVLVKHVQTKKEDEEDGTDTISVSGKVRKAKQPLSPDAFKKQRKKTETGDKPPKRPVVQLRDGLAIDLVNPEAEEGFSWHSRLTPQGIIQINAMHDEFGQAERRGHTVLFRYMTILVQKELTCAAMIPYEGQIFNSGFEKTFLSFWKASLLE
ncbi:MAG: ATP-binding protein [bacterium]|nr:ATP-binding protein [bacterium]